jgi:hypothetical protein
MRKKGGRARGRRREVERAQVKIVRARQRLVALEQGGAPERPLEVETPAVIESMVRALPCHQCEAGLRVDQHAAERRGAELLRVIDATCLRCHARRRVWFRLVRSVH